MFTALFTNNSNNNINIINNININNNTNIYIINNNKSFCLWILLLMHPTCTTVLLIIVSYDGHGKDGHPQKERRHRWSVNLNFAEKLA